ILRNSRAYIRLAADDLGGAGKAGDPAVTATANALVREVLLYDLTGSKDRVPSIRAAVKALQEARGGQPSGVREELGLLSRHAEKILDGKKAVDDLLGELLALPVLARGEELDQAYEAYHRQTLERTNAYRLYLYLLAVVLALYLAWVFLRLRRTAL